MLILDGDDAEKMGMFIRFMMCNKLKMSRFKFYKWYKVIGRLGKKLAV